MIGFRSPFVVRRFLPGTYVNGVWEEGDFTLLVIKASVQPVRGTEMQDLPEGRRDSQAVKIYTSTQLRTVQDGNPDIIQAFGSDFEITSVAPWQSNVINHYKCIGIKTGPQTIPDEARIIADGSVRMTADGDKRQFIL